MKPVTWRQSKMWSFIRVEYAICAVLAVVAAIMMAVNGHPWYSLALFITAVFYILVVQWSGILIQENRK